MEVVLTIVGCITIASIVDKILRHRREMEKIRAGRPPVLPQETGDLRAQLESWRQTSAEFDLSLEANHEMLGRRLDAIERRLDAIENSQRTNG
jgi:hypothetical protein